MWLVLILGTATGVAAAVIAVAHAALWQRLPVERPDDLVSIVARSGDSAGRFFPTEYALLRQRQDVLADIASYQFDVPLDLELGGRVERLNGVHVTANMFRVLGTALVAGRAFVEDDARPGAPPVAIVSERVWRTAFGERRSLVGDVIRIGPLGETIPVTVIGIAPAALDIQSFFLDGIDIYRPVSDDMPAAAFGPLRASRRYVIGRLRPGANVQLAESRIDAVARAVGREVPTREQTKGARLESLHASLFGGARRFVLLLGIAALFLVFVSCANAMSVAMALGSQRLKEWAVRLSMGASRPALLAQAVKEASVVAAGSSLVAFFVGHWALTTIVALAPSGVRRLSTASIGWLEVLAIAAMALVAMALLASGFVAARGRRPWQVALHEGTTSTMSRSSLRVRGLLLVGQQAVVVALLGAAGLMAGTLWNLIHQPLGFDGDNVWVAEFSVPSDYSDNGARYMTLLNRIRGNVQEAGFHETSVAFDAPLRPRYSFASVSLEGGHRMPVVDNSVMDGYFSVLRIPFVSGRDFHPTDSADRVVIVNRTFAERYLGGPAQALGRVVAVGGDSTCTVIGVVGDVREQQISHAIDPAVYRMIGGSPKFTKLTAVARSHHRVAGAVKELREVVARGDRRMYVNVTPLMERRREQTATARLQAMLLGLLAGFTLALASLGVFALVAQFAADRRRELGLRSALGAGQRSLIWEMVRRVAYSTLSGIGGGVLLGWWATRTLESFLFNVARLDARVWLGGILLVAAAALAAAWLPARRAANMDPSVVLRHE